MRYLAGIFALLTGASGWFYLFYSRAAHRLGVIEDERINRKRILLRRVGGLAMVTLGACFYAGYYATDISHPTRAFAVLWFVVLMLMMFIMLLGLIDLRLTRKLREEQRRREGR